MHSVRIVFGVMVYGIHCFFVGIIKVSNSYLSSFSEFKVRARFGNYSAKNSPFESGEIGDY